MTKRPSLNDQAVHSQTRATWVASIIAAFALIISLFSLYESHEARVATLRDELLLLSHRPNGDQSVTIQKVKGSLYMGSITIPWEVLISNIGSSTASITGYEVLQTTTSKGEIYYSGIEKGLFSPDTKEPVTLPIILEAGKSIRLLVAVGIDPGPKAYKVLIDAVGEKTIPLRTAEKLLAKNGIDLYDNLVVPFPSKQDVKGWSIEQQGKEQIFLFNFHTARGTKISEMTSWYDIKRF
jgi:hypothetical protein